MQEGTTAIYMIGYGARTVEAFVETLTRLGIAYLIDVRSRPYSRYKPEFSKEALAETLKAAGIRYVFMGDTLGGQPEDPDCYVDGKVDYSRCKEKEFYQAGLERLNRAWDQQLPVVLMCSEGKPEQCHRSKLIAPSLMDLGIPVIHIDESDQLISQAAVMDRVTGGQPSLFGDDFLELTSRKRYRHDETAPAQTARENDYAD